MKRGRTGHTVLRFILVLIGFVLCFRLIVWSASVGASRIFTTITFIQSGLNAADTAVKLCPRDPEARYARALTLVNLDRLPEAVADLQHAIRLRPHHYYQWMDLGVTTQRLGNVAEATAALKESIRLAPSFAQPHWQLGNLLFREGRYDEAFVELRFAVRSNADLNDGMLDLAWVAANGDVARFEALTQPNDGRTRFSLARFLARQGKDVESVRQAQAAGQPANEDERRFLSETISEMVSRGNFSEAFDLWRMSHPSAAAERGKVINPDFTEPILSNDPGFGWQPANVPNIAVSLDSTGPVANARSLRLEFSGESPLIAAPIQQLVLVEPNSRYSLSFMARTEKIVSGGPPVLVVSVAGSQPQKILVQSKAISAGSSDWTVYSVEFSTEQNTKAINLGLQRLACAQSPCPVFGTLWVSRFKLARA